MSRWLLAFFIFFALSVQAQEVGLPDPTRPLSYAPGTTVTSYTLTSVFRKAGSDSAIINGQLMTVGQTRGNIQLISVAESSATIKTTDGIRTLIMHRKVKR